LNILPINKNKKRVVSTLFLYLLLFITACDLEQPEQWETPEWYLPITVPLIDKKYEFCGMQQGNECYIDENDNCAFDAGVDKMEPYDCGVDCLCDWDEPGYNISSNPDPSGDNYHFTENPGGSEGNGQWDSGILTSNVVDSSINFTFTYYIPMGDSLGIPDNIFNLEMEQEISPGLDMQAIEISVDFDRIPVPINIPFIDPGTGCLPNNFIQTAMNNAAAPSIPLPEITIDDPNINAEVKEIVITKGETTLLVTNNLPVAISVSFTITSGKKEFFSGIFDAIPANTPDERRRIIKPSGCNADPNCTTDPAIIDMLSGEMQVSLSISMIEYGEFPCPIETGIPLVGGEEIDINFLHTPEEYGVLMYIEVPSPDPIINSLSIPSLEGIELQRAGFDLATEEYPNELQVSINNPSIFGVEFNILLNNIFDDDTGDFLNISISADAGKVKTDITSFAGQILGYGSGSTEPISNIEMQFAASILPYEDTLEVVDGFINIEMPAIEFVSISNMRLAYIAAIVYDMTLPAFESPPISGMPQGMDGFEFNDIIMEMEFYNMIGIPVDISILMEGAKPGAPSSDPLKITSTLNTPTANDFGCSFAYTGDTAKTYIRIDKNRQVTYNYCPYPDVPIDSTVIDYDDLGLASIIDLMNYGPEQITFDPDSTIAKIGGKGVIVPNSYLWGSITLTAPLSFIFTRDIKLLPDVNTEPISMDPSNVEMMDSALVQAALYVELTNSTPLGGSMDLLVSDSTLFPIFLDSLITGTVLENNEHIYSLGDTIIENQWEYYLDSLATRLDNTYYIHKTNMDASCIKHCSALYVEFFEPDSITRLFFIGKLVNLAFAAPDLEFIDDYGLISPDYFETNVNEFLLDTTKVGWIASGDERYVVPMITFYNTSNRPRTFQTSNYFGVSSYLTFTFNTGGLSRNEELELLDINRP